MASYTPQFIRDIPKTDLHLHLDGSLRLQTLIDLAKEYNVELPSYTQEGLKELVFKEYYQDLGEYLHGFKYTCGVLRWPEALERVSYELAQDNQQEGVRYIEIRFAPQLHMDNQTMTMELILESVNKGLKRATDEFNRRPVIQKGEEPPFNYGIIVCAMRMFGPSFSPYYGRFYSLHQYSDPIEILKMGAMELAQGAVRIRDQLAIPIVGFDLAGQEDGYPAEYFTSAYKHVHKYFMHKTVHAGEAYGAESIFQALTDLDADRLGHGYYLFDWNKITDPAIGDKQRYIDQLSAYIAERRITIEVCLTSNLQTNPNLTDIKNHSVQEMLARNISVTFCTDNRLVSNTTVSQELQLALDNFPIPPKKLKDCIVYGLKRSFYPGPYGEKRKYVRQVINYFDKIAQKHKINTNSES
jgi:adenosine deaminase